jgi:hypothetical protein
MLAVHATPYRTIHGHVWHRVPARSTTVTTTPIGVLAAQRSSVKYGDYQVH